MDADGKVVDYQYKEYSKICEAKRLSLLAAPDRFQPISEREDRSVLTVESIMAHIARERLHKAQRLFLAEDC